MLWVSQFGIVAGQPQEYTPWVGLFPEDVRSPDSSDLYLIVSPARPGSEQFAAELKEAVGTMFHKSKVSLTGGVLRALQAAHENLRDWNRRSMRDHQVAAGVSCAGVRGNEAYLAQVAPASALLYNDGKEPTTLRPSLADATEPLGLYDEFWPEFTRFEMEPGDRLLLLTPNLADTLPEDAAASLALPAEEILPAFYRHARSLPDCGAVLIAAVDGPELPSPAEI